MKYVLQRFVFTRENPKNMGFPLAGRVVKKSLSDAFLPEVRGRKSAPSTSPRCARRSIHSFRDSSPMAILPQDRPWREWYQLNVWRRRRRLQLLQHPLCALCEARGVVTPATVGDHVTPHRGDWNAFRLGPLQSLCADCHGRMKHRVDLHGYSSEIGGDGWPLDPKHPANGGKHHLAKRA
jgi:5-methylcytosine-specific restriction endonuclease McrA